LSETTPNNPDYSTTSPGAILKRCREYHNITLDDASEATKIGVNYLVALEEDQIKEFSSQAYLKGFLRIYATHLGLNADDIMRLYEKLYAPAESFGQSAEQTEKSSSRRRNGLPWRKLTLPAGLLLLILVTAAIMNRSPEPVPQPQPARLSSTLPAPAMPAVQPVFSSAHPPEVQKNVPPPEPAALPAKEEKRPEQIAASRSPEPENAFILRMKVTSDCILAVTIDGTSAQDYELTAGDVIEWKADQKIALELSDAGGVEAELDGKPLQPFGPAGKPAYVVLDAKGIK